ncbi:MAG: N-acetylglucosamine kinase [Caldilinea sp.]|jgi:N-acetylglucosamine kinase-like BadF-type ATPase
MTAWYLGVDGGGTKTEVAICDAQGHIVGWGQGGAAGIDSVGAATATISLRTALSAALQQAGLPAEAPLTGAFFGMAGVVSPEDRAIVHSIAGHLGLHGTVNVDHDIRIALAGGLAGRPGIALISGTGSSCFGINARGERWQSGGWGHLIADEGSSYWLGCNAIRLAIGTYDGRWQSALLEPVQQRLGLKEMTDIHHRLYTQGLTKSELAAFAPLVVEAAQAGDLPAQQVLRRGMADLAQMVEAVARHLGWGDSPCEVTLTGGLWRAGASVLAPFQAALAEQLPAAILVQPELAPVLGACVLALQMDSVNVKQGTLETLKSWQRTI